MRDSEIFLRRTDRLADQTRLNVDDLADILGISRASLYGYRKGQRNISSKAWLKLESAEKAAGIGVEPPVDPANGTHVSHLEPAASDGMAERIGRMEAQLSRLAAAIEVLVEKTTGSSPARGQDRAYKPPAKKRA